MFLFLKFIHLGTKEQHWRIILQIWSQLNYLK